jgi:hypothetical protein
MSWLQLVGAHGVSYIRAYVLTSSFTWCEQSTRSVQSGFLCQKPPVASRRARSESGGVTLGQQEGARANQARQAAEKAGRDARSVGREGTSDATRDLPILAKAMSDLAESVASLASAVEAMSRR